MTELTIVLRLDASPELLDVLRTVASFAAAALGGRQMPPRNDAPAQPTLRAAAGPFEPPAPSVGGGKPERAARPHRATAPWVTAERDALLHELWPTLTPKAEVRARLAKLPGGPVPDGAALNGRAGYLRLRRPDALIPPHILARRTASPPAAPPPVADTPAVEPTETIAPARRPPSSGKLGPISVAARLVADDDAAMLDCPMTWPDALQWAIRHKPDKFKHPISLKDVQAIRDFHNVPRVRIVKQRGLREELPDVHLIAPEAPPARAAARCLFETKGETPHGNSN